MSDSQDRPSESFAEGKKRRPIAVALNYQKGDLPKVVASGRGAIAEKILEIAFANGVKVREDRDLAELLSAVELNCPIPVNCFEAVAEILRYLYQANARLSGTPVVGMNDAPLDAPNRY
ncbi:MAG: EscU/YscU/HrcU family type III secretion system export apparatus switch protein [Elstera sp.]